MRLVEECDRQRVWIVDDDESVRKALRRLLVSHGFEVETFSSGREASRHAGLAEVECLVLDIAMPDEDGLEVYARMQRCGCHAPAVFITANGDGIQLERARKSGSVLRKPFENSALLDAVASAVTTG